MKFCQPHWDKLRAAVESRGLGHLVAANGRDAHARALCEYEAYLTASEATVAALTAERDTLAARVEALEEGNWPFEWEVATRERTRRKAAEDAVRALTADKERLDWIQEHGITIRGSIPGYTHWTLIYKDGNTGQGLLADIYGSLRAAIERARTRFNKLKELE